MNLSYAKNTFELKNTRNNWRKLTPNKMIFMQLVFNSFMKLITAYAPGLAKINYISHVIIIFLFFWMLRTYKSKKIMSDLKFQIIIEYGILLLGVLSLTLGSMINADLGKNASISVFLKGILNYFRFPIFFFVCVYYLKIKDLVKFRILTNVLFWINLFLVTYQYFVLGLYRDNLGGIFGTIEGCNAGLNIFCCIIVALTVAQYLCKKTTFAWVAIVLLGSIYEASLAEIKIFYIEVILIILLSIVLLKPNRKTIMIIVLGLISIYVGLLIFKKVFPDWYETIVNGQILDLVLNSKSGYSSSISNDLSRTGMFKQLQDIFFEKYPIVTFWGFGLGSFDPTSTGLLMQRYYHLHAEWFTNSVILLNSGFTGVILYYLFFASILIKSLFYKKDIKDFSDDMYYIVFAIVMLIISFMSMWYNNALVGEMCAYWMYFVMAIPFVIRKERFS